MKNNMLEVHQVSKRFGNFVALDQVSIHVPENSIFGLLGPNGAGKTTLIRIINQIILPDQGRVMLSGEPLHPSHVALIGYLPEERGLYKSMKVGEQALYLAQLKGLSRTEAKKRLLYWFDKLDMGGWWNKKIHELSKGMAQKVQFIVTVMHRPKLLIFDEPFSGFDPVNANLIKDEILQLRKEGATVIFSTHRMESVEELCDHIALIHKSQKVLEGKINVIKQQFKTNTFEASLYTTRGPEIMRDLNGHLDAVVLSDIQNSSDRLRMKITLGAQVSPNDFLQRLSGYGQIHHFTEMIPSVNEIFIKTVSNEV